MYSIHCAWVRLEAPSQASLSAFCGQEGEPHLSLASTWGLLEAGILLGRLPPGVCGVGRCGRCAASHLQLRHRDWEAIQVCSLCSHCWTAGVGTADNATGKKTLRGSWPLSSGFQRCGRPKALVMYQNAQQGLYTLRNARRRGFAHLTSVTDSNSRFVLLTARPHAHPPRTRLCSLTASYLHATSVHCSVKTDAARVPVSEVPSVPHVSSQTSYQVSQVVLRHMRD